MGWIPRKELNALFDNTLKTFYLWLYGVGGMDSRIWVDIVLYLSPFVTNIHGIEIRWKQRIFGEQGTLYKHFHRQD